VKLRVAAIKVRRRALVMARRVDGTNFSQTPPVSFRGAPSGPAASVAKVPPG